MQKASAARSHLFNVPFENTESSAQLEFCEEEADSKHATGEE